MNVITDVYVYPSEDGLGYRFRLPDGRVSVDKYHNIASARYGARNGHPTIEPEN